MSTHAPWSAGRQRWVRNLAFLSFSFANTACITVFPQHHFWRHPQESLWTAVVLLGGAVAALLGLAWAARRDKAPRPASLVGGCAIYGALLLAAGSGAVRGAPTFAVLVWVLSFVASALMQRFDQASVQQAGLAGRVPNDLSISLLRFLGMLAAPCAFSLLPPGSVGAQGLLIAMTAAVALSAWRLLAQPVHDDTSTAAPAAAPSTNTSPHAGLARWAEWGLWAGGVLVYANYCVLASAAPFLLRDLLAQPEAMGRAWLLISIVYAAAMLSNAVVQWRRWAPRLAWLWGAPVALIGVGALLCLPGRTAADWLLQGLASAALGTAFGLFMMGYRDHLTRQALQHRRPALLARYNQMPRWATLLAFAVLAALAGLHARGGPRLADGVAAYLLLSSLAVVLLAPCWARRAG